MTKGLGSGILSGGVVGALVMSMLSLYAPLPQDRIDVAPKLETTPTETETAPVAEDTAEAVNPEQDAPAVAAESDPETVLPSEPETAASETSAEAAEPVEAEVITGETAETATTGAPAEPVAAEVAESAAEVEPVVPTETASASSDQEIAAPSTEAAAEAVAASAIDTVVEAETAPQVPTAPSEDATPVLSADSDEIATRVQPSGLQTQTIVGEEQTETKAPTQLAAAKPAPDAPKLPTIGATETEAEPASADTPIVLPTPNAGASVVTNRLPSVGGATEPEVPSEEAQPVATEPAEDLGALARFAAPVEGIEDKSLMAFVLIDSGEDGLPREDLKSLAVPVTVALDPVAPNAATIMAEYRAAGVEVVTIANDLPTSAGPGDVATAVSAYFDVLNQSVAIMDPLDGRIQSNRSLLQPVLGAIRDTGHGLITYDRGLNTAQQAARRENIPAATVFRVLDADLEKAPKIKRYLDRAAFSANQDGAVVVVGRSYPETVRAMVEWSLEKKDASIAVVPVSAVMLAEAES